MNQDIIMEIVILALDVLIIGAQVFTIAAMLAQDKPRKSLPKGFWRLWRKE
jgi:hypothetical protein